MNVRYTVTEENYLDFSLHHALHSPYLRKQAQRARVLPPLLWFLLVLGIWGVFAYASKPFPPLFFASVLGISLAWFFLYPSRYRRSLQKRLMLYAAEGNGKEYLGGSTFELLDGRMRNKRPNSTLEVTYDSVEKLVENAGCLYIYIGAMTAIIIPLDAFGETASYREFRNRLEEKVHEAKTAKAPSAALSGDMP